MTLTTHHQSLQVFMARAYSERYALVEYGVGKSQAILQLFRQEEVQKAFRQAFDADNPSIAISASSRIASQKLKKSWNRMNGIF